VALAAAGGHRHFLRHGPAVLRLVERRMHPRVVLPRRLADFDRRGFRTDRPAARAVLERAASSFLDGFNLAARSTTIAETQSRLADVEADVRGFSYEGAGMHAALADLTRLSGQQPRAVPGLAAGPGQDYGYLIHVGAGWPLAMLRSPHVLRLPATPLVRWLAVDGAAFGAVFFGGEGTLRRICNARQRPPGPLWRTRVAGAGRALWFCQSADVVGVARLIGEQPSLAAPELWAGIGLACAYAGPSDTASRDALRDAAGPHLPWLRQGVLFASAARARAGIVPPHTVEACRELVGIDPAEAAGWADQASTDLLRRTDVAAYDRWRDRLIQRAAHPAAAGSPGNAGSDSSDRDVA